MNEIIAQTKKRKDLEASTYILTSGSSGKHKIVRLSLSNHLLSAIGSIEFLKITESDHSLLSLPLFHVGGVQILFRTLLTKSTLLLDESLTPTRLSFVPVQLKRFLSQPHSFFPKTILLGGQSPPLSLCNQARDQGHTLVTTYGMSEMSGQITGHFFDGTLSLGKPLKYRQIKIDENQEILVKGSTLFLGYLDQETPLANGYFKTKDLGKLKPNLYIIGRKDRQFISGGENIQPEEIEKALLSIKGIHRALVEPVEDLEFGMRPHAKIFPLLTTEFVQKELKNLLPKFMIPKSFELLQEEAKIVGNLL